MSARHALATVLAFVVAHSVAAMQTTTRGKGPYERAVQLEAEGNHPAALSLLWEAAGSFPHDADVQNRLGEALDRIGALDAAVGAFSRALAARPEFQKAANNLVLTLVKAGRGDEALERARELVARRPDDPARLFTLALAQAEQDVEEAIRTFRRVLTLEPRHVLARYNLALVLKRTDRLTDALDELRRALQIAPRAEVHYTLGIIYWHQGDLDRAVAALRAAVAAEPSYVDAHYSLGAVLKAQRDWAGAIDALRRAIALRPDLVGAHHTLAQVLQLSGEVAAARAQLVEAEELRRRAALEHEASVWTSVGTQKLDAGDLVGALDHLRRATSVFEAYAPAHYQMGRVLQRLGEADAAQAAFARAHTLNPSLVPPGR